MTHTDPSSNGAAHGSSPSRPARLPRGSFLSPAVRRVLRERNVDVGAIADVVGTGAGGRVTRADVLAATSGPFAPAVAGPGAVGATSALVDDVVVPFSPIRRRIAAHLLHSVATAPHAFSSVTVDFHEVDRVRRAHGAQWRAAEGFGLTYLPFVARAVTRALAEFPDVNGHVDDQQLVRRGAVHLGIAVDLDHEGLIVPVVRDAQARSLAELARDIASVARRARAGALVPDEVVGGTFTITNPGPTASRLSVPIINQSQVGILATDGVRRRVVVVSDPNGRDALAVHPLGLLGLSFDHRAVDVFAAGAFLARVRELLETTDWVHEL